MYSLSFKVGYRIKWVKLLNLFVVSYWQSHDSTVSIVTIIQTICAVYLTSYPMDIGGLFPWGKL
jgi:hypothetical protein